MDMNCPVMPLLSGRDGLVVAAPYTAIICHVNICHKPGGSSSKSLTDFIVDLNYLSADHFLSTDCRGVANRREGDREQVVPDLNSVTELTMVSLELNANQSPRRCSMGCHEGV